MANTPRVSWPRFRNFCSDRVLPLRKASFGRYSPAASLGFFFFVYKVVIIYYGDV